jgi:hypothetical protein
VENLDMKKIIVFLTIFVLVFSLAGCRTYEEAQEQDGDWAKGYFTVIKSWGGTGVHQCMIVYANDTKVMYYIDAYSVAGGITTLYNADGTLQVYDGE